MTNTLIADLIKTYRSGARCAAALGMSRQAFNAALKRGHLSNDAALHAAALLNIDPGAALLANATATPKPAAPILNPAPALPCQPPEMPSACGLYYVKSAQHNKTDIGQYESGEYDNNAAMRKNVHSIISKEKQDAIDLLRWVYAVAKYPADSPRFAWYVSRWLVPEKIARAKAEGTFEHSVRNCPPIDPTWVRFVPDAIAEYHKFTQKHFSNREARTSSSKSGEARNIARPAA